MTLSRLLPSVMFPQVAGREEDTMARTLHLYGKIDPTDPDRLARHLETLAATIRSGLLVDAPVGKYGVSGQTVFDGGESGHWFIADPDAVAIANAELNGEAHA